MRTPSYTRQFQKDLKRMKKRGKELAKIKAILSALIDEEPLAEKHRDHALVGNFQGRRECHIEPDWLLIYKLDDTEIIFERTGSHSDLFK
ncbi:MAG: type II toxin-antitoxin system YafQ family toxin [Chloroflexota bacterium]